MTAQTISGTFSMVLKVADVNLYNYYNDHTMSPANVYVHIEVYTSANAPRDTLFNTAFTYTATANMAGQGWATTLETRIVPPTALTSLAVLDGDRLVVSIGQTVDSEDGHNLSFVFGDPSATADHTLVAGQTMVGVPWIEFSQDLFGAGGTNVTVAGSTATATSAANAGTVSTVRSVVVAGAVATATALALTGVGAGSAAQDVTYAGSTATATSQALTGAAVGVRNVTVPGSTATATGAGLPGSVTVTSNATIGGGTASATALALNGTVATAGGVTVPGNTATATATALTGTAQATRNVTIAGGTGAATALALPGTVTTTWTVNVNGGTTTATALALPGSVATVRSVNVAGSTATATAQALSGTFGLPPVAPVIRTPRLTLTLHEPGLALALHQPRLELVMTDNWHVGDLEPPLAGTAKDGEVPVSLATASTVTANIRRPDATIITREVTKGDQTAQPGSWVMPWQTGDINVAGTWSGDITAEWPGLRPQTFGQSSWSVGRTIA